MKHLFLLLFVCTSGAILAQVVYDDGTTLQLVFGKLIQKVVTQQRTNFDSNNIGKAGNVFWPYTFHQHYFKRFANITGGRKISFFQLQLYAICSAILDNIPFIDEWKKPRTIRTVSTSVNVH
ncbi:hypothetical protein ACDQ55_20325 [Chitinophaga sp. 30R24]|uniref:hypothetical protein n=1 Tax=Chitinophaga sp. 30R24 TaxID=3248838 RepID=UPI003B8F8AB8